MRRFTSILVHTADFGQHTGIALQDVPNRDYTLRLFRGNEELELQAQDNQTWTAAQRPYVPCFFISNTYRWLCMCRGFYPTSEMRVEIQMRSGHLIWAKNRVASDLIDLQMLFDDYWNSSKHEFTVPSEPSTINQSARI